MAELRGLAVEYVVPIPRKAYNRQQEKLAWANFRQSSRLD